MRLLFGQQNAYTAPWFRARLGQSASVAVEDFPHTAALRGDVATYLSYLAQSWRMLPRWNTESRRARQLARLLNGIGFWGPIRVVQRPNGDLLIADGNHRAAIAHCEGREAETVEVPTDEWLAYIIRNSRERYGTAPGRPYQSVFAGPAEIVVGRRRDTLSRHLLLPPADLTGRVLDLGCNIGAASFLAADTATDTLGVDVSPRMLTTAARLAAYLDSPAAFELADLEETAFIGWDTVLCFSVLAHVKRKAALRRSLTSARVVFIEENAGHSQYRRVRHWFRHADRIEGGERVIWRCEP